MKRRTLKTKIAAEPASKTVVKTRRYGPNEEERIISDILDGVIAA